MSMKYHKIQTVFKREIDKNGKYTSKIIDGLWTKEEFKILKDITWNWYEKIDGTNIRINFDGENITFAGRTDKAIIPNHLMKYLQDKYLSQIEKFKTLFNKTDNTDIIIFGEGYGHKIQAVGDKYLADNKVSFIGFDININGIWLKKEDVKTIFDTLDTDMTPLIYTGNITEAINIVKKGFNSKISHSILKAEGLVGIPVGNFKDRMNNRIITKLKTKDFN